MPPNGVNGMLNSPKNNIATLWNTYLHGMAIINYLSCLLLLVALAFPMDFTRPLFAVWLITWALEFRFLNKSHIRLSRSQIPIALLIVFVLWEAVSLLWTPNLHQGVNEISKHAPIFIIALMAVFGCNDYYRSIHMKIAVFVGCVLSTICYLFIDYWVIVSETVVEAHPLRYAALLGEGPIEIIKHRLYYCLVLVMGLCFSGSIYSYLRERYNRSLMLSVILFADILLIAAIIMTGSRSTILLLPILGLIYAIQTVHHKRKWLFIGGAAVAVGLILALLVHTHPRFQELVRDMEVYQQDSYEQVNVTFHQPRIAIWHTIIDHRADYGVKGLGIGSEIDQLKQYYSQMPDSTLRYYAYGPHSTYLYAWMILGPLGIVALILILCSAPFFFSGQARRDCLYLCLNFGWAMLTENVIVRMSGLYILFAMIILIAQTAKEIASARKQRRQFDSGSEQTALPVYIDYQAFTHQRFGGVSRYYAEIYARLLNYGIDPSVHLLYTNNEHIRPYLKDYKPEIDIEKEFIPQWHSKKKVLLFKALAHIFPMRFPYPRYANRAFCAKELREGKAILLHATYFDPYFLSAAPDLPFVITIHDMIDEVRHEGHLIPKLKALLARRADHIIAVSEYTKQDIMRILHIPAEKITVIHHGCSLSAQPPKHIPTLPERYVLYVGGREREYKNFALFVQAMRPIVQEMGVHLLCVGQPFSQAEKQHFEQLGLTGSISSIHAEDDQLYYIYHHALCFIFPSCYEGFGLPILEAFASACPLILSDSSCFPEIAQDAALYFKPNDADDLTRVTRLMLTDASLREEYIRRGLQRKDAFSWDKAAQQTAQVYLDVIDN